MKNIIQHIRENISDKGAAEHERPYFGREGRKRNQIKDFAQVRGFSGIYWHGSKLGNIPRDFAYFKTSTYFARERTYAALFGHNNTFPFYLRLGRSLDLRDLGTSNMDVKTFSTFLKQRGIPVDELRMTRGIEEPDPPWYLVKRMLEMDMLNTVFKPAGYDSVIQLETYDKRHRKVVESIIIIDPRDIKLAHLQTFDDEGNEIPLESRFDTSTNDVRY